MGATCTKQKHNSQQTSHNFQNYTHDPNSNQVFQISNGALITQPESFSQAHTVKEDLTFSKEDIQKIYNFDPNIIGKGEFGHVRTASLKCCPRKKFAIKTISKEKVKSNMGMIINEVEILKKCDHPNIVKFYETYQDEKFLHLVLQYCRGGQLQQSRTSQYIFRAKSASGPKKVNIYTESQAKDIMFKIFSSVKYMHQIGIVHRDLKLENFVFNEKSENNFELKLIDFGLSEKFSSDSDKFKSIAGTYMYIAPEILQQTGYTKSCDIWSCGVILYYLLSGQYPFYTNDKEELFNLIKKGKYQMQGEIWSKLSKDVKDLISKLLVVEDNKRISAAEALNHQWFKSIKQRQINELKKQEKNLIKCLYQVPVMPTLKYQAYKLMVGLLDEETLRQIREQFRLIDFDNDGLISFQDLQQCQQYFKEKDKLTLEQIQETINRITSNCENKQFITYTTFIIAQIGQNKNIIQKNLNVIFNLFDIDHTGKVTKENLKMSLAREGRKLQQQDINSIIEQVDFNNDNFISKQEFINMMKYDNVNEMREQYEKILEQNMQYECEIGENYSKEYNNEITCQYKMNQYLCKEIYNKNHKNMIQFYQPFSHQQIRQNDRKNSSFDYQFDDDFEQKLIEDQFMCRFDTSNNQQQKENIMKLQNRNSQKVTQFNFNSGMKLQNQKLDKSRRSSNSSSHSSDYYSHDNTKKHSMEQQLGLTRKSKTG